MKKIFIAVALIIASSAAQAMSNMGSVTCATSEGEVVALYKWFSSEADKYTELVVFVKDLQQDPQEAAKYKTYTSDNLSDFVHTLQVTTVEGKSISVILNPNQQSCTIKN